MGTTADKLQYLANTKALIKTAIEDKGQTISSENTFRDYVGKIENISTECTAAKADIMSGKTAYSGGSKITGTLVPLNTSDATATASDILNGKTAYASGLKVTGAMINNGNLSQTITSQGGQVTVPTGYHSGSGVVTATFSNLTAENIKSGVNVGGVVGSLQGLNSVNWGGTYNYAFYYTTNGTKVLTNHPKVIITVSQTAAQLALLSGVYLVNGSTVTKVVNTSSYDGGGMSYDANTKTLTYNYFSYDGSYYRTTYVYIFY
jgi:hypothetical protein